MCLKHISDSSPKKTKKRRDLPLYRSISETSPSRKGYSQHLPNYYSLCKQQIKLQFPSELVRFVFLECIYDSWESWETDI